MAMISHPVTGLAINEIQVRTGPISDQERKTAQLLLNDGHARWLVAAMLGRFPLAFNSRGRTPSDRRRKYGSSLSRQAAKSDPRQISMDDLAIDLFQDLFGPDVS